MQFIGLTLSYTFEDDLTKIFIKSNAVQAKTKVFPTLHFLFTRV